MQLAKLRPGIEVSQLCYGTLTLGPLQKGLTPKEGGRLLRYALEKGINFFDTAELYGTYPHLREGLKGYAKDVVISTKSYAYSAGEMHASLELARRELDRDYIDIFLLHEQESRHTLKGHREALEYLCAARERGLVRAVGISTHHVAGVEAAAEMQEIDVIHPLINVVGVGIVGGDRTAMEEAIKSAHSRGKGIYAMKALAGGSLYRRAPEAFSYILSLSAVDAVAVGMGCVEDIDYNAGFFNTGVCPGPDAILDRERRLIIEPWCTGCGECVESCPNYALDVSLGKAVVDTAQCLLCGYCVASCPDFFMKVI
jgi:predicted aldo/keto reductase-like oxidoreductase